MRIKRFTAPDMAQAMRQVRQALGPDAVILSTGRLPDGGVEISAAVDEGKLPPAEPPRRSARVVAAEAVAAAAAAAAAGPVASPASQGYPPAPEPTPAARELPDFAEPGEGDNPLGDLVAQVRDLSNQIGRHLVINEAASGFFTRPEVAPIYSHLKEQEVDPAVIQSLLEDLNTPGGMGVWPRLSIRLKKLFLLAPPLQKSVSGPLIWALVGPTGVGKTTTVAKLAATFALRLRLRVGLVTVDTYRIAAAEQLKVYGQIMEIPTKVASGPGEYAQALDQLSRLDLILVDTVGRSPEDEENLEELANLLKAGPQARSHLVLAAPTRDVDQKRIVERFKRFAPHSMIFTKLDETRTFGPILNQVVRTNTPVSYFTTGQRVPDDLEEATRDGLVRRLLPPRPATPGWS
ncbi:MAG: flagellar biosynthesis protein FlhF [Deltaproteobacteria bacterium]|nr:flagellar biosynthesis protein FlhF [Deltaproteobacteria bacterium]